MIRKIEVTINPERTTVYNIRSVDAGKMNIITDKTLDIKKLYVVYETINFFYACCIDENEDYLLLKVIPYEEKPDDIMCFVANKHNDSCCLDFYISADAQMKLFGDKLIVETGAMISESKMWICSELIKDSDYCGIVKNIETPEFNSEVRLFELRDAFNFLYTFDMRNKIIGIVDPENHSVLITLK